MEEVVHPERFERPTLRFVVLWSITQFCATRQLFCGFPLRSHPGVSLMFPHYPATVIAR